MDQKRKELDKDHTEKSLEGLSFSFGLEWVLFKTNTEMALENELNQPQQGASTMLTEMREEQPMVLEPLCMGEEERNRM